MAKRVLIVDDREPMRDLLTQLLEMTGYETSTASNGKEGVRRLHEFRPDLVITDLYMPVMDGNEFSRIVRMTCDAPIMMLSALEQGSGGVYELNLVDDYVMKPIDINEFALRVRTLLKKRRA